MKRTTASSLLSPQYRAASLALMSAVAIASYNNLSVTAALPDIGDDLGRVALLPWIVTVELMAAAVAVLIIGPYIDGSGARRAFRLAVVSFTITSAACMAAPTMELLVAARLAQGLAAGALIGTAITCIGLVFDDDVRPSAYALMSSVWGIMGIGGPAVAAVLVSTSGWRAVFAVNLPVALVAGVVGWRRLPAEPEAQAERFDARGLVILSALTVALLAATSSLRWQSLALAGAGLALAALYLRHASGHPTPVVRLGHVTDRRWRYIHVVAIAGVSGGMGASVYLPLYLKAARGSSAAFAAFAVVWPTVGWSIAAWVSGRLQKQYPAQTVTLAGSVMILVATVAALAAVAAGAAVALVLAALFAVGWGVGTMTTASLSLLQENAGTHEMGRVSSAHHFIRTLGFTYGAAVAGLTLFWVVERRTGDTESVRDLLSDSDALVDAGVAQAVGSGFAWTFVVMAMLAAVAVPAGLALTRVYNSDRITQD